jgi:hypothetical protein
MTKYLSLIERFAQRDIALLLLGPVAAAGDGAIDDEIVAVDEGRFVAGEEHCGMRDISAVCNPMPLVAPVITATLPFSRPISFPLSMFARSRLASIFPSAGDNASELVPRGLPRQNRPIASGASKSPISFMVGLILDSLIT